MNPLHRVTQALGRLSVGQQLATAFGLVLVLMALLGGVALVAMSRMDGQVMSLHDRWLTGIDKLNTMRVAMIEARDFEMKHSRATDKSYHAEYEEKMTAAAQAVADVGRILLLAVAAERDHLLLGVLVGAPGLAELVGQGLLVGVDRAAVGGDRRDDGLARLADLVFVLGVVALVGGAAVLDLVVARLDQRRAGGGQLPDALQPLVGQRHGLRFDTLQPDQTDGADRGREQQHGDKCGVELAPDGHAIEPALDATRFRHR